MEMEVTGIYEKLITQLLAEKLTKNANRYFIQQEEIEPAEAALRLSNFFSRILHIALENFHESDDKLSKQINLTNQLIIWLRDNLNEVDISENLLATQGNILRAIYDTENPVAADLKKYVAQITPVTGLTQSELFTGNNAGISLESELKREILSADSIYWLVSFIKWTGIRLFREELETFAKSGRVIRVITTSYMGATDIKAVEFLANLPNAEVKLSYNTEQERLHAKSYLFLRNTGFHTGYIGSSNLSRSALTNGLEWNLKITSQEIPHIIDKTKNTFETYWQSNEFEHFRSGDAYSTDKLKRALQVARGEGPTDNVDFFFDIQPHMHQQAMLEKLSAERNIHHRWRNLIVAATGTGKTVISAFDFKRFYLENPSARLLFVAHREEILKQALTTFRGILKQSSFGDLWVGAHTPDKYDYLFVSVQTLNNHLSTLNISADFYDFIIIDEVHHIAATSYRPILTHFTPTILLGLTATPERHDGADILSDFCGKIAAELRLPEAINLRYLCPFQYFGVDDDTDLSQVSWDNGRYNPAELTRLYNANDRRVMHILRNMNEIISDISKIRALAFCVSKEHANYMAEKFLLQGIKSSVLTSDNSAKRNELRSALQQGKINILFVVDIFNEGIDIPEIDTVLFLRPTESLTIFLQQLGRGLRLSHNKECLTILDFVGNARPEYDFSQKFRALVGKTRISITEEIENDFPHLPLGCGIVLQKQARSIILNNIKNAVINQRKIIGLIRSYSEHTEQPLSLLNFLHLHPEISISDIYKTKIESGGGWSRLCINAKNLPDTINKDFEKIIYRGITNRLIQCTSRTYLLFIKNLISNDFRWDDAQETENQMALMLHYDFWQDIGMKFGYQTLEKSIAALGSDPILATELNDVVTLLIDTLDLEEADMEINEPIALKLHARYCRDQILAAFNAHTFEKKSSNREGVVVLASKNIELLFVTLTKSAKRFSPTTLYHDYAISQELFHWQSQNSARPDRGRGLSYLQQVTTGKTFILFVREESEDEYKRAMGFVNLGVVNFKDYTGSQPMNITWQLEEPIPPYLWHDVAKLAIA